MAVFQSKYRELSFYVNGAEYKFSSGTFVTNDPEVIAVLDQITDAQRVDKAEKAAPAANEPKQEPEKATAPKTTRKAAAPSGK